MEYITGACSHCGQVINVDTSTSQDSADEKASRKCDCHAARCERRTAEQIAEAHDRIYQLFGEAAEELGFKPLGSSEAIELLKNIATLVAQGKINGSTIQIFGNSRAKISLTSKGKIKVERSETRSCNLEAGE